MSSVEDIYKAWENNPNDEFTLLAESPSYKMGVWDYIPL